MPEGKKENQDLDLPDITTKEQNQIDNNDNSENENSAEIEEASESENPAVTDAAPGNESTNTMTEAEKSAKISSMPKKERDADRQISRVRKLKRGSFSAALTVIVVASVVVLNLIVNLLLERFDVKIDLTEQKLFSIDKTTEEYISALDSKVKLIITSSEESFRTSGTNQYYTQMNEIANIFEEKSNNISLEYVDLITNPTFSGNYGGNLSLYNIIVESELTGRYKVLSPNDYLNIKYYTQDGSEISETEASLYSNYGMQVFQDISAAAEQTILSSIMSVTDVSPVRVAFASGYGEGELQDGALSYTGFLELLEKNSFTTETIDLNLNPEIDNEIDFLILFAPANDYSIEALKNIDVWLDNNAMLGKTLIYVAGMNNAALPNTDAFLAEWGLSCENSYIFQTDANYVNSSNIEQYLQAFPSDYSSGFENGRFIGYLVRNVGILYDEYANFTTTPLLTSYDGATAVPFDAPQDYDIEAQPTGILNAAAESKKARYDESGSYESRVIVLGTQYLLDQYFLQAQQIKHAEFFINIFNTLSGKEEGVTLAPKTFNMPTFNITAGQGFIIEVVLCLLLPIFVLISGIVVWVRRRRL